MSFTVALVVLVGLLTVLNLALTVGVIRRLREHTERLSNRPARSSGPKVIAQPGEHAKPFAAVTVDAEQVSEAELVGAPTLIGAFAYGCTSCEERRPAFVELAKKFPGGRDRVLAVLVGGEDDLTAERAMLEPVARLVLQAEPGTGMTAALGVKGYPAFAVFGADGTVLSSATDVADLDELPAMARA
jgi:thiol-disulfide isomerase/thioredoxin